ncbi:hypothetical protein PIB30_083890 [Stylosanthes scabra]|uniref:Uncharacterized protein n=1 Tax=Stylosanthes scabra TaxID=79078 RepID=A0ABU6QTU7_9FABA|nr:hypothetical protein [Stylosanthes scabra]
MLQRRIQLEIKDAVGLIKQAKRIVEGPEPKKKTNVKKDAKKKTMDNGLAKLLQLEGSDQKRVTRTKRKQKIKGTPKRKLEKKNVSTDSSKTEFDQEQQEKQERKVKRKHEAIIHERNTEKK